jgi:RNA polymerase sigma-70 factor (ECF subfamily)
MSAKCSESRITFSTTAKTLKMPVQAAFLKGFQKLLQFQAKAKFSTWLGRITFNEALTKLRRDPVRRNSTGNDSRDEGDTLQWEIADWAPNPEMRYSAIELRNILETNLRRLSPSLRGVFSVARH